MKTETRTKYPNHIPVQIFDAITNGRRPRHLWEMGVEWFKVDFQLPEGLGRVSLAICTSANHKQNRQNSHVGSKQPVLACQLRTESCPFVLPERTQSAKD